MKKYTQIILLFFFAISLSGCEKFLEERSDRALSVPTTVEDFQAMLNNSNDHSNEYCASGEVSSDDYYLSDADFNALELESEKRLYTWQPSYVSRPQPLGGNDWYNCYRGIYACNSIIKGIEDNNLIGSEADITKGQALVYRAARYLDGVQVWAPAFNEQTADTDLGLVLRVDPDMNIPSVRSSVRQTYDLIVSDLTEAISLLPTEQRTASLPSKAAALGLLARAYLNMGEYQKALQNAQEALQVTSAKVIDFNKLDSNADFPIPTVNYISAETILLTNIYYSNPLRQSLAKINPILYNLYTDGDLRKVIYFMENADKTYSFKGTHYGGLGLMNILTPAEMLLIVAECNARLGNLLNSAEALNQLLIKRYKVNEFSPYTFANQQTALQTILDERRKELVMRGLRWPDIKRLNRDGHNIVLTRQVNGQILTLTPNDQRYSIAIPEEVVEIGGVGQNPR